MDPLQPISPNLPEPQAVHALTRVDPAHRDGRGSGGQGGAPGHKRRDEDEDAVQVELDGGQSEADEPAQLPAPAPPTLGDDGRPHIDLTA